MSLLLLLGGGGVAGGTGAARPTVAVEVEFTAGVWTAISPYVNGGRTRAGKQYELDRNEAGEARLVLKNSDGRFDPTNTASPYWPNVKPMRRIRIRPTWAAQTYDLWRGYVERWPQAWEGHGRRGRTDLVAVDGLAVLALYTLQGVYTEEVLLDAPVAYYPLDEQEGATSFGSAAATPQPVALLRHSKYGAATVAAGADPVPAAATTTSVSFSAADGPNKKGSVLELARDGLGPYTNNQGATGWSVDLWFLAGNTTDPGYLWKQVARSGSGIFDNGGILLNSNGTLAVSPVDSGGTTSGAYDDGLPHHVALTFAADGKTWKCYIDGALVLSGVNAAAFASNLPYPGWTLVGGLLTATAWQQFIGTGAAVRISHVAMYATALTSTRVLAHYEAGATAFAGELSGARVGRILDYAGWADGRALDAGQTQMATFDSAGKTALAALQETVVAEYGNGWADGAGTLQFKSRHARYNPTVVATFGDPPGGVGEVPYAPEAAFDFDDTQIRNLWQVTIPGGLTVRAQDATSKQMPPAGFGPRSHDEDLPLQSANEATDRAAYGIYRYKDPHLRLERLPVNPGRSPSALWPVVLGAAFGQLWRVERDPPAAPAFTFDGYVEGAEHDWTPDTWRCSFALSPADTATYWQLDSTTLSVLGSTTRLGY